MIAAGRPLRNGPGTMQAAQHTVSHLVTLHTRTHVSTRTHTFYPRSFASDSLFQILTPPCVFAGLVATLWTYKCLMLIAFQNKIIYMPSIPPFSRSEKLIDYQASCNPVHWKHHFIRASDGVRLSILEGKVPRDLIESTSEHPQKNVIIYFQG